jgi:hypothetical protein
MRRRRRVAEDPKTVRARQYAWAVSFGAALSVTERRLSKVDLQEMLAEAVRNTAAIEIVAVEAELARCG